MLKIEHIGIAVKGQRLAREGQAGEHQPACRFAIGALLDHQFELVVGLNVALEIDVRGWIATWNADPIPFAGTKTAEEILATPSTNISRISGAGH